MVDAESSYTTLGVEGFDISLIEQLVNFTSTLEINFFKPSLRNFVADSPDLQTRQYDVFIGTQSNAGPTPTTLTGTPFPVKDSDFDQNGEVVFVSAFALPRNLFVQGGFKAIPILKTEGIINYDFLFIQIGDLTPTTVDVFIKRIDQSFGPDTIETITKTISGSNKFFGYDVVPRVRESTLVGYDIIMVYEP